MQVALVHDGVSEIERWLSGDAANLEIAGRKILSLHHTPEIRPVTEINGIGERLGAAKQKTVALDQAEI